MGEVYPYIIATEGISYPFEPLYFAIGGWGITITEEEIPPPEPIPSPTGKTTFFEKVKTGIGQNTRYEKKKRKKIIVNIQKDGKSYFKEKIYKNVNVRAKDVKVEISETKSKPNIKITLLK